MKIREVIKNGYFTVRLTVSFPPPPPYGQLFVKFFCVFFILDYPQFLLLLVLISEWVDISEIAQATLIVHCYF